MQFNFGCQETDLETIMWMETVCFEGEMYSRQVENQGREGMALKLRCGVLGKWCHLWRAAGLHPAVELWGMAWPHLSEFPASAEAASV